MANIFVNYRRQDSAPYAGRLFDRLVREFPGDRVFMDIDGIAPGEDFVEVIDAKLAGCDAVVALIGHDWSTCTDGNGRRRLDNREDFVRRELAAALERRIRVIPVLVGGASMPSSDSVPEELVALLRRNALEVRDTRFHIDVDQLIEALKRTLVAAAQERKQLGRSKPSVDRSSNVHAARNAAPAVVPETPVREEPARVPRRRPVLVLVAAAASLLALGVYFWAQREQAVASPVASPAISPAATYPAQPQRATLGVPSTPPVRVEMPESPVVSELALRPPQTETITSSKASASQTVPRVSVVPGQNEKAMAPEPQQPWNAAFDPVAGEKKQNSAEKKPVEAAKPRWNSAFE